MPTPLKLLQHSCPIREISEVINLFLQSITKDMNQTLNADITKVEIEFAISNMNKDKSQGPNGLLVDFLLELL